MGALAIGLALAVGAISFTVTKGRIFRSARIAIWLRSKKLGELVSCPYCFSHWVSAILTPFVWPGSGSGLDFLVTTFVQIMAIVAGAAFVAGGIALALEQLPAAEWVLLEERARDRERAG